MNKRYYLLVFACRTIGCNLKVRLEEMSFDMIGRGHCPTCAGMEFAVQKEYHKELLGDGQIALIESPKRGRPRRHKYITPMK